MKTLLLFFGVAFSILVNAQSYDIYVSDAGNFNEEPWQILKFDGNGENPEIFIDEQLGWPQDILFLEDSNMVLISNLTTNRINRHDASTGAYLSTFASGISGPTRMKIGPDNSLYVLQWSGNGQVLRFDLDGTALGNFTQLGVPQSIGLDWDNDNNLYVSSYGGKVVWKFDSEGGNKGAFISGSLDGPTNIWFDEQGDLLVSDYNGTSVKRYNKDGELQGDFITGLSQSEGVDFFPNGDILIGNGKTSAVKLFNKDGEYLMDMIESGSGDLLIPNAVVLREKTSSYADTPEGFKPIIRPTIGQVFYADESQLSAIETIEVFNISGQKVDSPAGHNSAVWAPKNVPDGSYVIVIKLKNGVVRSERVVLQRG